MFQEDDDQDENGTGCEGKEVRLEVDGVARPVGEPGLDQFSDGGIGAAGKEHDACP